MNYEELKEDLIKAAAKGKLKDEEKKLENECTDNEKELLERLEHPQKYPAVVKLSECMCDCNNEKESESSCTVNCLFEAIKRDEQGKLIIKSDCVGCGDCIKECKHNVLAERSDLIPLLELLEEKEIPVYAMIAPAFSGQFSEEVTSGKLRSAFKKLGFYGMIEVALFADILTMKEALEFQHSIHDNNDFVLTSCCCPLWVALIKKSYHELVSHVPPSVSPMVACGRGIKKIRPGVKTVFIGPCLAKKAEAKEPDIKDAVDFVLTFQEVAELFKEMNIDPLTMPEDNSDHSSKAGRIYARTGGVSEAVKTTLKRLNPEFNFDLTSQTANGIIDCKKMLNQISKGDIHANFIEGMGCVGGCVGGPKRIIPKEEGTKHVNAYGEKALSETPVDNPNVLEILTKLGFTTIESLLLEDNTFVRNFNK